MPGCNYSLLLLGVAVALSPTLVRSASGAFAPVADGVLLSNPDERGASKVIAVGEQVGRTANGPRVGDKVSVDQVACSQNPVPGLDGHCLVPQQVVFGTVQPISSVPAVTPVTADSKGNVTVKGGFYDFYYHDDDLTGMTVTITGKTRKFTTQLQARDGWPYPYEITVPVDDVYVTSATFTDYTGSQLTGQSAAWRGDRAAADLQNGYVDLAIMGFFADSATSVLTTSAHAITSEWRIISYIISSDNSLLPTDSDTHYYTHSYSYSYAYGGKLELWPNTAFSGTPETALFSRTDINLDPNQAARFSAVLTIDTAASYTFQVVSNLNFVLYLFDQPVLQGRGGNGGNQGIFTYTVELQIGDHVPMRMDVSSSAQNGGSFELKTKWNGNTQQPSAWFYCPDQRLSVYAVAYNPDAATTPVSWAQTLAQAFVRHGTETKTIRVVEDPAIIPLLYPNIFPRTQHLSTQEVARTDFANVPVWHIADIDPRTGIIPVNKIELGITESVWDIVSADWDFASKTAKVASKMHAKR